MKKFICKYKLHTNYVVRNKNEFNEEIQTLSKRIFLRLHQSFYKRTLTSLAPPMFPESNKFPRFNESRR